MRGNFQIKVEISENRGSGPCKAGNKDEKKRENKLRKRLKLIGMHHWWLTRFESSLHAASSPDPACRKSRSSSPNMSN
jgi:hypothetical protein